jgi:hypothetical protein
MKFFLSCCLRGKKVVNERSTVFWNVILIFPLPARGRFVWKTGRWGRDRVVGVV